MKDDIVRKQFSGEIKQSDGEGAFEAIIATLNVVDSDGDIIVAGAFDDATVSVLPTHDSYSVPLGKAKMEDRGNTAVAVGQFNLDIPKAQDWHNALKFDLKNPPAVQEWSFAFRILDSEIETRDGEEVRILKKMDVMEVSPVLRGAGVGTGTLAAKQRFSDQLDEVLTSIEGVLGRAKEIAELRARDSKTLGDASQARIGEIREKFETLVAMFEPEDEPQDGPEMEALASTLAASSRRLGVDIE